MRPTMRQVCVAQCVVLVVLTAPRVWAVESSMDIVIGGGPNAGTYRLPSANMVCMHVKARGQFSAAYKDPTARNPKVVSGAGLNLFDPDNASTRRGQVNVRFGDPDDRRPAAYETAVIRDKGFTYVKKGAMVDVGFDGLTSNGTKVRVTARCTNVDEF